MGMCSMYLWYRCLQYIMYVAAINKRYENLVSNLAWSDCIYFYGVEKSLFTLPLNFLLQNQHMRLILRIVDDRLKRVNQELQYYQPPMNYAY